MIFVLTTARRIASGAAPSARPGRCCPRTNSPWSSRTVRRSTTASRTPSTYIMHIFLIVKRKDELQHGEYPTKRVILEIYDAMQKAIDTGQPYHTRLAPPAGPPSDAEGNFIPMTQWDPDHWPKHIHRPRGSGGS